MAKTKVEIIEKSSKQSEVYNTIWEGGLKIGDIMITKGCDRINKGDSVALTISYKNGVRGTTPPVFVINKGQFVNVSHIVLRKDGGVITSTAMELTPLSAKDFNFVLDWIIPKVGEGLLQVVDVTDKGNVLLGLKEQLNKLYKPVRKAKD